MKQKEKLAKQFAYSKDLGDYDPELESAFLKGFELGRDLVVAQVEEYLSLYHDRDFLEQIARVGETRVEQNEH